MESIKQKLVQCIDDNNDENLFKYLKLLLNYNKNSFKSNLNLLFGNFSYVIRQVRKLEDYKYEILYYNNALPMSENTIISFNKIDLQGFVHNNKIIELQDFVIDNKILNCKCVTLYNSLTEKHIVAKPCSLNCKNISKDKYNIRYYSIL